MRWKKAYPKRSNGTVSFSAKNGGPDLSGKRVLVTGAAGFIGSHLSRRLVELDCRTTILVRPSTDLWRIRDIVDGVDIVYGNLRRFDAEDIAARLPDVEIIYHLGAAGLDQSLDDDTPIVETNVMGTLGMLQLARALKVERFVYCGSCFEYGEGSGISEDSFAVSPVSQYAASKSAAYLLANSYRRRYGLPVTTLRPFTVYGPFEADYRLIPQTITSGLEGADAEFTGGKQTRDFVFVGDAVEAFVAASVSSEAVGDSFNVCTGLETSVKQVISEIFALTGDNSRPLFGALPYRDTEIWELSGDPTKAREKLRWEARTSLRDGLIKTIQWQRDKTFATTNDGGSQVNDKRQ